MASTNIGMGACCLSGTVHSGKPRGRDEEIGGLATYVIEPSNASPKKKTVIFLVDIFGWKLNNIRLLADQYADAGFCAYIPDLHQGDSIDEAFLQTVEPPLKEREAQTVVDKATSTAKVGATLGPWLLTHRESVSKPLLDGFINTIKLTPGTDKIGAIGFCWGGRYAILAAHGLVDAAVACHPSLIAVPGDFEAVSKPLSLACGDKDSLLSVDEVNKAKSLLEAKKDVPSEVVVYEDQIHGFALRGDFASEKDKKAMDDAQKQGIAWFNKYL